MESKCMPLHFLEICAFLYSKTFGKDSTCIVTYYCNVRYSETFGPSCAMESTCRQDEELFLNTICSD